MVNVGVFGYGTVGSGVVEVINQNAEVIKKNVGDDVKVKAILDLRDFPGDPYESLIVHDVENIVGDPEISVICETMGGVGAALKFTEMALKAGKSVCTSNKELVALHGPRLLELAKENKCNYRFEASVGGGIPIIRPLMNALTADKLVKVTGIVNGTTNYMLTKMTKNGADFDDVLKEAQDLGYAELHPEADVEGFDAARKLAILSSLIYGKTVNFEDIPTEGITRISAGDIAYAKALKYKVKLLAKYEDGESGAYAMVAPFFVGEDNPLHNVDDVFNAIAVRGNMLGDAMFYGKGAGKLPTASAVVGDVVECAKNIGVNVPVNWADETVKLSGFEGSKKSFFVRVASDAAAKAKASFDGLTEVKAQSADEYAFITKKMSEKEFAEKTSSFGAEKVLNYIRIED